MVKQEIVNQVLAWRTDGNDLARSKSRPEIPQIWRYGVQWGGYGLKIVRKLY